MSSRHAQAVGDRPNWSFIIGALVLLTISRGVLWHFESELGFTSASLNLIMLGALFGFTIPWLVVSGLGYLFGQLSERHPSYARHLQLYLQASLWLVVYHTVALWVRTVTEYRLPLWIGWIAQPALYAAIVVTHLRRRR